MIRPRLSSFSVPAGSPNATIPIAATIAVPTAAQTAYVSPTGSSFSTSASIQNEIA